MPRHTTHSWASGSPSIDHPGRVQYVGERIKWFFQIQKAIRSSRAAGFWSPCELKMSPERGGTCHVDLPILGIFGEDMRGFSAVSLSLYGLKQCQSLIRSIAPAASL